MHALVLWDVDNTLIASGGVSEETYAGAFELLTGFSPRHRVRTAGRTDPEILGDLLAEHGFDRSDFNDIRMAAALADSLGSRQASLAERGRGLPGGQDAIDALASVPGLFQSVLTGNVRANAVLKLATFGLDHGLDWDCGGYGFDSSLRWHLVGVAQRRATAKYGASFTEANTVLIGDSVNDVFAGVRGGAKIVAVATGTHDMSSLREAGATAVLAGLEDTDAVVASVKASLSAGSD